jgi:membrane protease YdiL (CAAX protease family)
MGHPAPPYGPQYGHGYTFPHPPPPDPPELPSKAAAWPRWPWWYGPVAMGLGLVATFIAISIALVIMLAAGVDNTEDSKGYLYTAAAIQYVAFTAAALFLASRTERPRAWHFGLRRTKLWPTIGWTALGYVSFFVFAGIYAVLVEPEGKQETLDDLGTKESDLFVVGAAILVIVLAPLAEEFFFRAFFYRALRTKLPIVAAALINGAIFGVIHYESTDMLDILPILAILGVIFCLVYEKTGSLFAVVALHALNNIVSYGSETDEWVATGIVGGLMLVACFTVPAFLRRTPTPA